MPDDPTEIRDLLKENLKVSHQNQLLLEKLHRASLYGMVFRVLWIAVLIGIPFLLYYFFIEPYMRALGFNTEQFRASIQVVSDFFHSDAFRLPE